jgi:hypothetical protein
VPPVETKTARFTRRKPGPIIESTEEESLGRGGASAGLKGEIAGGSPEPTT